MSVVLFFSLKTVANLGRSRKTDLGEILPKDFGKEHFLAEEMVTNGDFCPWLAVKSCEMEREKKLKYVSCHCKKSTRIKAFF